MASKTADPEPRKQVAYLLPRRLIKAVKQRALKREMFPAQLVREILEQHFAADRPERSRRVS